MKTKATQGRTPSAITWGVLALIVLAALLVRLPGLQWGSGLLGDAVPYVQLHPDEPRFVEAARALHNGTNVRRSYVLGLSSILRLRLLMAGTEEGGPSDREMVLTARWISLLSGLALVVVVFLLVRERMGDVWAALLAAGLVGFNTLCLQQATFGTADMPYTFLLYLFALLATKALKDGSPGIGLVAAATAGLAMAFKFGVVLWPSLLLLGVCAKRRTWWWSLLFVGVAMLIFLGAQGFAFNAESVAAIRESLVKDNIHGFQRSRWLNPLVYMVELVRVVGLPVALLCLFRLTPATPSRHSFATPSVREDADPPRTDSLNFMEGRRPRRPLDTVGDRIQRTRWFETATWIAWLPIFLHGLGILLITTTFPRHLLPIVPWVLMLTVAGLWRLERFRIAAVVVTVAWSIVLAMTDGMALWRDSRGQAVEWMAGHLEQDKTVYGDPYFRKVPVFRFYPPAQPSACDVYLMHEGWTFRFKRSELNPLREPAAGELYRATEADQALFQRMELETKVGSWEEAASFGPPIVLPEQWAYDRWWGSLNKFAGKSRILVRR